MLLSAVYVFVVFCTVTSTTNKSLYKHIEALNNLKQYVVTHHRNVFSTTLFHPIEVNDGGYFGYVQLTNIQPYLLTDLKQHRAAFNNVFANHPPLYVTYNYRFLLDTNVYQKAITDYKGRDLLLPDGKKQVLLFLVIMTVR